MSSYAPLIRKPAAVPAKPKAARPAPVAAARPAAQAPVQPGVERDARVIAGAGIEITSADDPREARADQSAARILAAPAPRGQPRSDLLAPRAAPRSVAREMTGTAGHPLAMPVRREFEQRFGHDFSLVRVHTGARAAESARGLDALAFSVGHDIVFGRDAYAPFTVEGRQLLAHELAHTIQSESRDARRLQRRRIPSHAGLSSDLPSAGVGFDAARTGLVLAIERAWDELTPARQAAVRAGAAVFGITWPATTGPMARLSVATRAELLSFANLLRSAAPNITLGDPALIDTGARPGTTDAANITTLVARANAVFAEIASGARDADIAQVFGVLNVAAVKAKYANAHTRMNQLKAANKIVTDRSGYSAEAGLGGLSNSAQIAVEPSAIDVPTDKESIVTLVHESMHAGNAGLRDFGYIDSSSFTRLPVAVKLANAAHYEVVPRRILGADNSFPGVTFTPAGGAEPALTPREQAIRDASETFRLAWTAALNLHKLYVRLFRAPGEWNTLNLSSSGYRGVAPGARFSNTLPFWSKVEALTIHTRAAAIAPAGPPATAPVTLIDIALSEGVVRKMAQGLAAVEGDTPADALALENASATPAERTAAAASSHAERDLLIRLVLRTRLGSLTGSTARDERVVAQLARVERRGDWADYLRIRSPAAFP
jgi:hypothetical protein